MTHQLGHGHRRMGVVELDGDLVRERWPVVPATEEPGDDVGQGAGDEEVFLDEPERAAPGRRVVGVQNAADRLREDPVRHGAEEIAAAELAEIEDVRGRGLPEAEGVDRPPAVADHRPVVGHAEEVRGLPAMHRDHAPVRLEPRAERHLHRLVRARHLPGVRPAQPVVGVFDLGAVPDLLAEDPVIVAEAVADGRDGHRGHGLDEAGRKPSEPAVAEPGVRLLLEELGQLQPFSPGGGVDQRARASGW